MSMLFQPIKHTGLWVKEKKKTLFSQLLNPTKEAWQGVCTALGPLIGGIEIYHVSEFPFRSGDIKSL